MVERNILLMLAELHVRGYQRLRIVPHIYSLGTWRCGITHAANTRTDHGAMAVKWDNDVLPQYTSASRAEYFGWTDAAHVTPSGLARRFIERYDRVSRMGYGPDWQYTGWYSHLLHLTYPDALPYAMAEHEVPAQYLYTTREGLVVPLPPPGWASREEMAGAEMTGPSVSSS